MVNFTAAARMGGARLTLADLVAPGQELSQALKERLGRQVVITGLRLRS